MYEKRPPGCVEFACQYLKGVGEDTERPDKVGFVLDCQEFSQIGIVTVVYEYKSGTFKDSLLVKSWVQSHTTHRSPILLVPLRGTPILHATRESVRDASFRLEDGRIVTLMAYA